MIKKKKIKSISKVKKFFAIVLIIILSINLFFVAIGIINETLFWIDLGFLFGLSYIFYKNDK